MNSFLLGFIFHLQLYGSLFQKAEVAHHSHKQVESHLVVSLSVALFTAHLNSRISEHKNLLLVDTSSVAHPQVRR